VALRGDLRTLRSLKKALQKLPITASARIAERGAPAVTALARASFDAGRTAYGSARPRGVDGDPLSLEATGATKAALRFIAVGTTMRTANLPRYARYLIGRYDLLPNGPLPAAWRDRLQSIAAQVLYDAIHSPRGGA
jgi:hypothetical protein